MIALPASFLLIVDNQMEISVAHAKVVGVWLVVVDIINYYLISF